MTLLSIFRTRSKFFFFFLATLAIVNSLLVSGLLIFISNKLSGKPLLFFPDHEGLIFVLLLCITLVSNRIFQTYMIKLTNNILYDFQLSILKRLRFASFQVYEKFGAQKIYAAISDTQILAALPEAFINCINSLIVIVCGVAYLVYVSPIGGIAILGLMTVLLIFYLVQNRDIEKNLNSVRDMQEEFHQYLRDLLLGFKEIKMSKNRNDVIFHKFLKRNRFKSKELGTSASMRYMDNELIGKYSWYIVLGAIIFFMPSYLKLSIDEVSAYVLTILYLMGPVAMLIMVFPTYTRTKIAMERINQLNDEVQSEIIDEVGFAENKQKVAVFESLELDNVAFEYPKERTNGSFAIGPLNFDLKRGEVVFITGGNGSGKSTFVNVLTGLYKPASGSIYLNGSKISSEEYCFFSDKITAIFTDHFLFSENYDEFELNEANPTLKKYIDALKLSTVVKFQENKNIIENKLSKGQQKRLAMIYAMMEDREIMLLDEWAAEQDPEFRAYFYKELIPILKTSGKTIIAITHDDKYFKCADRIVKFDYGKIAADERVLHERTEENHQFQ
jgi:cyclic peptide transporter